VPDNAFGGRRREDGEHPARIHYLGRLRQLLGGCDRRGFVVADDQREQFVAAHTGRRVHPGCIRVDTDRVDPDRGETDIGRRGNQVRRRVFPPVVRCQGEIHDLLLLPVKLDLLGKLTPQQVCAVITGQITGGDVG
jgi:hypothetical protein